MAGKPTIKSFMTLVECGDISRHFILFGGQAEAGKSTICRDSIIRGLMAMGGPIWHKVVILSPSCKMQDTWSFLPQEDLFDNPMLYCDIIEQIVASQKERDPTMRRKVLIVIDDVIGSLKPKDATALRTSLINLATSGRWFDVCCWVLTQQLKDPLTSNTAIRNNVRLLVCAMVTSTSKDELVKMVGSKDAVDEAFKEPYRFVTYDYTGDSTRAAHRLSYCKIDMKLTPKLTVRYRR